jgi:hypothetical protein
MATATTLNRKKKITIVKATTWSRLMNAPVRNQLEKKMEMAITNSMRHRHSQSQLQVRMAMKIVAVFFWFDWSATPLIGIMAEHIQKDIAREISEAGCFAIMVDETKDCVWMDGG